MGRMFFVAIGGISLAIVLAVASLELGSAHTSLAGAAIATAVALALASAVLLVTVWRRDSRAFDITHRGNRAWTERLAAFDANAIVLKGRALRRLSVDDIVDPDESTRQPILRRVEHAAGPPGRAVEPGNRPG